MLRMKLIGDSADFLDEIPIEIRALTPSLVQVRPLENLSPGDYSLATGFEKGAVFIFLSFDFGVSPHGHPDPSVSMAVIQTIA